MKGFLNALFAFGVMFAVISVPVAPMVICSYYGNRSEISTDEYSEIRSWTKEFPQLLSMVKEASWEDNLINRLEYAEIKRTRIKLRNEQILQEMVGE